LISAEKISKVKAAEALAETLYLEGVGIARQRSAIAKGIQSSALDPSSGMSTTREIMDLILVSQYLDMLVAVGAEDLLLRAAPSEILNIQKGLPQHHAETVQPPDLLT
jgi:hypothetical protein